MPEPPTVDNSEDLIGALVSDTPAGVNIDHDRLVELFSERRLGSHFGPQGVSIADARQKDCPLIAINEGFVKLTGYQRSEVLGHNCRFLQGKDTDPVAVSYIRRAIETGRAAIVTLMNYRKNGEAFWNRLSLNPIRNAEGKVVYFVGVQSDVSALRTVEQEYADTIAQVEEALGGRLENQKNLGEEITLRETLSDNREGELRDLLATLTHELRQPSLSISGLLKILQADENGRLDDDEKRTLALARQASDRMKKLIDRLAELVVVEETPVLPQRVSLGGLISELIDTHAGLAERYGVTVRSECTGQDENFISEFQVHEALSNILKNAMIHGSRCDDPVVTIACDSGPGLVRIEVKDNGPGIPKKLQPKVFALFARANVDKDRPGSGIGLTVARRLMSRIDGTIGLESDEGRGTKVIMTFPINRN
ncbi:MAG: ATP-binding protein [Planctomycetota bacterium]